MKTILYAGTFQMPDKNAAAHRVLNNAKILQAYGYHVVFVGVNSQAKKTFIETKYVHETFDIFELNCNGSAEKIKKFSEFAWLDELENRYDISAVIAYDYCAVGLSKLRKTCRKKEIPLIVDTDEWFSGKSATIAESVIRAIDSEWRMRWLQKRVDGVIAISKYLWRYYHSKVPTIVVPPLVDKQHSKWDKKAVNKDENCVNIVYSGSPGRMGEKDRLDVIIHLLDELGLPYSVKLTVVGVSEKDFLNMYPEWVRTANSNVDVCFMGRVPHEQALEILKNADFSVFLRDDNKVTKAGFPTKFVESISAGIPVITNNTSDIAMFLGNGVNGYLLDDDLQGGLNKIFMQDIAVLKGMKANVRTDTFDYRKYVETFEPIIQVIERYPKNS